MTSDPAESGAPQEPEVPEEAEAEARFNETLGRLVNTPHKPHKAKPRGPRGEGDKG